MNGKNQNEDHKGQHHELGNLLKTILNSDTADKYACYYHDAHKKCHFFSIAEHVSEHIADIFRSHSVKCARKEFYEVIEHPAGYGRVVHHKQIASDDAEPAVNVPLASLRFQRLIALDGTLTTCASDSKLHREDRNAHNDQEDQIKEDEHSSTVLTRNERELPHITDTDRTSGGHQQESETRFKILSFHNLPPPAAAHFNHMYFSRTLSLSIRFMTLKGYITFNNVHHNKEIFIAFHVLSRIKTI